MPMNYEALFCDWELRHTYNVSSRNVDQAECSAIKFGSATIESSLADELISDSLDDISYLDYDNSVEEEIEIDDSVSTLQLEIDRRCSYLGDFYPFERKGNSLVYKGSASGIYELCLGISSINVNDAKFNRLPRLFEEVAAVVFATYVGMDAKYLRTGWPNGETFKNSFRKIHEITGEWLWNPSVGLPDVPSVKSIKDGGIDFVVWRDVIDSRQGKIFYLGQCACGNNWDTKFNDINMQTVQRWFDFPLSHINPMRVFATPYHIIGVNMKEVAMSAGIPIDRIRLSRISEENKTLTDSLMNKFSDDIIKGIATTTGGEWISI